MNATNDPLKMTVYASLMAALIAVGAMIAIPIGPVPVVLQNFFVMLAALLLGSRWATAAVAVYLLAGACGLPIFAGGKGGLVHFIGPTGGYLLGYLPAVFIMGLISEQGKGRIWVDAMALVIGAAVVYACGVPWLKHALGFTWNKAMAAGMLPFIPGDIAKIVAAVIVSGRLRVLLSGLSNSRAPQTAR